VKNSLADAARNQRKTGHAAVRLPECVRPHNISQSASAGEAAAHAYVRSVLAASGVDVEARGRVQVAHQLPATEQPVSQNFGGVDVQVGARIVIDEAYALTKVSYMK
jgi:hypothetical protein